MNLPSTRIKNHSLKIPFRLNILFLFSLNLMARIPFLFAGYGREEDAWGQALTAKNTWESGIYEVSRLPGHPLYEILLALLWPINHSYFTFNLLSALASSLAVVFFYLILKEWNKTHSLILALSFGFIPVFFIAGLYTIDYNFACLFILISLHQLQKRNLIWAGILLGIATGFRISSIAFVLPWIILAPGKKDLHLFLKLIISSGLMAIVSFSAPIYSYGLEVLDFHKPPYSSWAKIAFKLSFGIWGLLLFSFLSFGFIKFISSRSWKNTSGKKFNLTLIIIIVFQLLVFFRLPFKSEFLIPALPFILIWIGDSFSEKWLKALPYISICSCFLVGFDYKNEFRGSPASSASIEFSAGAKDIFIDPLQGPTIVDFQKRKVKMKFVSEILKWSESKKEPSWVISGWYWPQIELRKKENSRVKFDYYSSEEELLNAKSAGRNIFYLPEINEANLKIQGHNLADSLGTILIPE